MEELGVEAKEVEEEEPKAILTRQKRRLTIRSVISTQETRWD